MTKKLIVDENFCRSKGQCSSLILKIIKILLIQKLIVKNGFFWTKEKNANFYKK